MKRHLITYGDQHRNLRNRLTKLMVKAKNEYFSGKMGQTKSRVKLFSETLSDALGFIIESTFVEQLIDENHVKDIVSYNKKADKLNYHFTNTGNTHGDNFSDSYEYE